MNYLLFFHTCKDKLYDYIYILETGNTINIKFSNNFIKVNLV